MAHTAGDAGWVAWTNGVDSLTAAHTADLAGKLDSTTASSDYAALLAAKNVFTGKTEINGGFTNSYDTDLWIAGPFRNAPTISSQSFYSQGRIGGDLGALVHDGVAAELRITSGTNSTFINALETTLEIGGASTLADARSITSNFVFDAGLTGTLTTATAIRAQSLPALPSGFTIGTVYGLYVEPQTVGGTNYSIYAPTGTSLFGNVTTTGNESVTGYVSAANVYVNNTGSLSIANGSLLMRNSTSTGTFFSLGATGIPRWNDAGIQQTTVGPAGAATAPPATPTKWLRVSDSAGTSLVIPAYLAS